MRPLDEAGFEWFGMIMIIAIVVGWGSRDAYLLVRYARAGNATHDQLFGSIMGIVMVTLGAIGFILHLMER